MLSQSRTLRGPISGRLRRQPPGLLQSAGDAAAVTLRWTSAGYAGLYQVNAVLPADTPAGDDVPLTISVAGQTSRTVTVAVR